MAKKKVARTRYALCGWLGTRQVGGERRGEEGGRRDKHEEHEVALVVEADALIDPWRVASRGDDQIGDGQRVDVRRADSHCRRRRNEMRETRWCGV